MESSIKAPYSQDIAEILTKLQTSTSGLNAAEAAGRLESVGRNVFPVQRVAPIWRIILRQFLDPFTYIMLAATAVSLLLRDYKDAIFIGIVLLVNATIGTIQEYGAERSAQALRQMTAMKATVRRDGETLEVDAETLVPGDIVLLESGNKIPADMRLIGSQALEVDESLLTGESVPVAKSHDLVRPDGTSLAERQNMGFTGTLVTRGRGRGVVITTGLKTELGGIAGSLIESASAKPPLLIRMEIFTKKIAFVLMLVTAVIAAFLIYQGLPWNEVMLVSVALAVASIPEGLPVALTVALSIASRRMARRNVIVRKLPTVEALGSCTYIATDKTGTLTVNQLTIQNIALPGLPLFAVGGTGLAPEGKIGSLPNLERQQQMELLQALVTAGVLCNESQLVQRNGTWQGIGDAVDLAFLVLAHKAGFKPESILKPFQLAESIPFEPQIQYAATLHHKANAGMIHIKGAAERVLVMCSQMQSAQGLVALDSEGVTRQVDELAADGYRVLALASGAAGDRAIPLQEQLHELTFLGLVGMIDPLRPEAAAAIASCKTAGIEVAMVTGDHPKTSLAIARKLGLAKDMNDVVSGTQLKEARSQEEKVKLIESAHVFARVEPQQKLEIVQLLLQGNRFVAVTGDGANDAPALHAANVGVAMGKSGTDVAKETADLIITDDRFASIVSGIEEGRIAYGNVRKVIYLLISTGTAEILMFTLSLASGLPLPLTAVQLLWLNLVTNGIQDVALVFEPGEGDELSRPPRKPNEPIFNRLMIERVFLSALVMGGMSFWFFHSMLRSGVNLDAARNLTLLLMVLFENMMVGNCRSETKSAFLQNPLRNPFLLLGTIGAQLIHLGATYTPVLQDVLGISPVSLGEWGKLLSMAVTVLLAMEIYKLTHRKKSPVGILHRGVS